MRDVEGSYGTTPNAAHFADLPMEATFGDFEPFGVRRFVVCT